MTDLKFVSWKEAFLKSLEEPDHHKAAQLIHEAELAMYQRQRELADPVVHRDELSTMSVAAEALRVMKRELDARRKSALQNGSEAQTTLERC